MSNEEKLIILQKAYALACKWIRENPPADLDLYFSKPNYIQALASGANDPEGKAWQLVFIQEAVNQKGEK